jgi:hypothetical protein
MGRSDLSYFNGGSFSLIDLIRLQSGKSQADCRDRLNQAGWKPTERTKGYLTAQREKDKEKLAKLDQTAWMVSETNLQTLPDTAPAAARSLAMRIMLASRARTLNEWLENYNETTRRITAQSTAWVRGPIVAATFARILATSLRPNLSTRQAPLSKLERMRLIASSEPFGEQSRGVGWSGLMQKVFSSAS